MPKKRVSTGLSPSATMPSIQLARKCLWVQTANLRHETVSISTTGSLSTHGFELPARRCHLQTSTAHRVQTQWMDFESENRKRSPPTKHYFHPKWFQWPSKQSVAKKTPPGFFYEFYHSPRISRQSQGGLEARPWPIQDCKA